MTENPTPEPENPEAPMASDPLGKVKGFVEEHPVAMVAGGILLGALVAGALARPGSGKREGKPPRRESIARTSLPRRAMDLAALGVELAAAYAAGAASEKAAPPTAAAPDEAKPATPRLPGIAGKALRILGPLLKGKKAD